MNRKVLAAIIVLAPLLLSTSISASYATVPMGIIIYWGYNGGNGSGTFVACGNTTLLVIGDLQKGDPHQDVKLEIGTDYNGGFKPLQRPELEHAIFEEKSTFNATFLWTSKYSYKNGTYLVMAWYTFSGVNYTAFEQFTYSTAVTSGCGTII